MGEGVNQGTDEGMGEVIKAVAVFSLYALTGSDKRWDYDRGRGRSRSEPRASENVNMSRTSPSAQRRYTRRHWVPAGDGGGRSDRR